MYYKITYQLYLKHTFNNNNIWNIKYNVSIKSNHYNIILNLLS